MKIMLVSLAAFLIFSGIAAAESFCPECYVNSITQDDQQYIHRITIDQKNPVIFNEATTAAVTITPPYTIMGPEYIKAGFSKTEQSMVQTIDQLLPGTTGKGGADGLFANKAMQAAWTENQGGKEYNKDTLKWDFEGAFIKQETAQSILNAKMWDGYDGNGKYGKQAIFNADSKLAVISDTLANLQKTVGVTSSASNSETATGTMNNNVAVNANVAGDSA